MDAHTGNAMLTASHSEHSLLSIFSLKLSTNKASGPLHPPITSSPECIMNLVLWNWIGKQYNPHEVRICFASPGLSAQIIKLSLPVRSNCLLDSLAKGHCEGTYFSVKVASGKLETSPSLAIINAGGLWKGMSRRVLNNATGFRLPRMLK